MDLSYDICRPTKALYIEEPASLRVCAKTLSDFSRGGFYSVNNPRMSDDAALLHRYVNEGSETAFRELVERHIQLVTATARRMVAGDAHLAQDVTQLVFTDLARQAKSLPRDVVLGGWLHRHTCFTAAKAVRAASRRRARERTAKEMHSLNASPAQDAQWRQLAPVLDEALNRLAAADRDAIVLRYFERRDLSSIGVALGISDDTAQKRIGRALDKLRGILLSRGVTFSTALLATTLDAGAKTPMPASLVASVSTTALHSAAHATGFTLASLKSMITSKLTLGLATTFLVASAAIIVVIAQQNPAQPSLPSFSIQAAAPAVQPAAPVAPPAAHAPYTAPSNNNTPAVSQFLGVGGAADSIGTDVTDNASPGGSLSFDVMSRIPPGSGGMSWVSASRENGMAVVTFPDGSTQTVDDNELVIAGPDGVTYAIQSTDANGNPVTGVSVSVSSGSDSPAN
jgi:RNA polymerase sigma factor (sigma-70 family)